MAKQLIKYDLEIRGVEQLMETFKELPEKANRRVMLDTFKKAARPFINDARRRARPISGTIAKAIRAHETKNKKYPTLIIEVEKGNDKKYDAWFAHFFEFGTVNPRTPRKGTEFFKFKNKKGETVFWREVKGIKARPFFRAAWDAQRFVVINNINKYMETQLQKYLNKRAKRIIKRSTK